MDTFSQHFEEAIPHLRKQILEKFTSEQSHAGFRSIWEHFEDVINPIIIAFLIKPPLSIPRKDIIIAKSKSVYPDLKVSFKGKVFAIDVKSGEDSRNPWYDMGRLDTFEEKHLEKYSKEYYVTVRWKGRDPSIVLDVFIEPMYYSVGYREEYNGVLYRPYDGKIRPKSWEDFESGYSHWNNIDEFLDGLNNAKVHRRTHYILLWYQEMNNTQRSFIRDSINHIDKGKQMPLFSND